VTIYSAVAMALIFGALGLWTGYIAGQVVEKERGERRVDAIMRRLRESAR